MMDVTKPTLTEQLNGVDPVRDLARSVDQIATSLQDLFDLFKRQSESGTVDLQLLNRSILDLRDRVEALEKEESGLHETAKTLGDIMKAGASQEAMEHRLSTVERHVLRIEEGMTP